MASKGDYFGLGRLVSIILAIIPITAWICFVFLESHSPSIISTGTAGKSDNMFIFDLFYFPCMKSSRSTIPSTPPKNHIQYLCTLPLCIRRIAHEVFSVPHARAFMKPSTTCLSNHAIGVEMHAKMTLCVMN